jgi:hypothetical protein
VGGQGEGGGGGPERQSGVDWAWLWCLCVGLQPWRPNRNMTDEELQAECRLWDVNEVCVAQRRHTASPTPCQMAPPSSALPPCPTCVCPHVRVCAVPPHAAHFPARHVADVLAHDARGLQPL